MKNKIKLSTKERTSMGAEISHASRKKLQWISLLEMRFTSVVFVVKGEDWLAATSKASALKSDVKE